MMKDVDMTSHLVENNQSNLILVPESVKLPSFDDAVIDSVETRHSM